MSKVKAYWWEGGGKSYRWDIQSNAILYDQAFLPASEIGFLWCPLLKFKASVDLAGGKGFGNELSCGWPLGAVMLPAVLSSSKEGCGSVCENMLKTRKPETENPHRQISPHIRLSRSPVFLITYPCFVCVPVFGVRVWSIVPLAAKILSRLSVCFSKRSLTIFSSDHFSKWFSSPALKNLLPQSFDKLKFLHFSL